MKKFIILLCALFGTINVHADDDVPAILFFHNDSIIQSFLRSEVDSLGYSYIDIKGEKQNELTTQLVYLKDTVIQIPLAEIDSVIYTPPSYSCWVLTRYPKDIGHYKATLCGTLGGKFAPDAVIKETGFLITCYSKGEKNTEKVTVGKFIGDFEKEVDFKEPEYGCESIYYYRAYAVVNGNRYVGAEKPIFLSPIILTAYSAKVSKEPITENECSVTVYGELALSHRKEIEEAGFPMGFFVSKEDNPEADGDDVQRYDGKLNDNGLIESVLNGLEPGTKYYYRPFIETCKIIYGGTGYFVTPPQVVVTTGGFERKATTAELYFSTDIKMDENQLNFLAPVGIQIERDPNVPTEGSKHYETDFWLSPHLHKDFSAEVNGLLPETKYNYRAYTEFKGKMFYGETKSFTTKNLEVRTYDATDVTSTNARISGELMEVEAIREGEYYGFYYDTQANVDKNSHVIHDKFKEGSSPSFFLDMAEVIELTPGTTYYYRAFVTYGNKTYFGEVKQFTTEEEGFYGELGIFELKGHVKAYSFLSEDGSVLNTRTFDENGMWLTFGDVTINSIFPYGIERDKYGRIVRGVYADNGDYEEYTYDDKGRVIKYVQTYDGGGESHTIYYDESDTMVRRNVVWLGVDREYFDDYELTYSNHVKDSHGNWTSRSVHHTDPNVGNYNEVRQIIYYK